MKLLVEFWLKDKYESVYIVKLCDSIMFFIMEIRKVKIDDIVQNFQLRLCCVRG